MGYIARTIAALGLLFLVSRAGADVDVNKVAAYMEKADPNPGRKHYTSPRKVSREIVSGNFKYYYELIWNKGRPQWLEGKKTTYRKEITYTTDRKGIKTASGEEWIPTETTTSIDGGSWYIKHPFDREVNFGDADGKSNLGIRIKEPYSDDEKEAELSPKQSQELLDEIAVTVTQDESVKTSSRGKK